MKNEELKRLAIVERYTHFTLNNFLIETVFRNELEEVESKNSKSCSIFQIPHCVNLSPQNRPFFP